MDCFNMPASLVATTSSSHPATDWRSRLAGSVRQKLQPAEAPHGGASVTAKVQLLPAVPGAEPKPLLPPKGGEFCGCSKSDFTFLRTIGAGSFGRVSLASHIATNQVVAIKTMSKVAVIKENQVQHVNDERDMLMHVSGHPFLVNCRGHFQDVDNIYLVMDFVSGGEFFTYMRDNGRIRDEAHARFYVAQIVLSLEYLHSKDIAYRDLKPENLLIGREGYIKLTDFGFAKVVKRCTYTMCGTPDYLAPEVITGKGHTCAVDWWSLGCVMYELLSGWPPFYTGQPLETYKKILARSFKFPDYFTSWAQDLISLLLTTDPAHRLGNTKEGVAAIKRHTWFQGINWEYIARKMYQPPYVPQVRDAADASLFDNYDHLPPLEKAHHLTASQQAWFASFSS